MTLFRRGQKLNRILLHMFHRSAQWDGPEREMTTKSLRSLRTTAFGQGLIKLGKNKLLI